MSIDGVVVTVHWSEGSLVREVTSCRVKVERMKSVTPAFDRRHS